MDLEDRILRKNVPGRWSTLDVWENDVRVESDDGESSSEIDENENQPVNDDEKLLNEARDLAMDDVPESVRRSILAERERKHKTGVKGVLADYKQSLQMEQAKARQEVEYRMRILTEIAEGHKQAVTPLEPNDLDDQDFLESFRRKRLQELKVAASLPRFGQCLEVDQTDFVDMVDKEDPRVFVVVHLYETSLQSCVRLNGILEQLAHRRPELKFLRMNASSNGISIDTIALPVLTVYRAGEVVCSHAALDQELGQRFTLDDIDWLLEAEGLGPKAGSQQEVGSGVPSSIWSGRIDALLADLGSDDDDDGDGLGT